MVCQFHLSQWCILQDIGLFPQLLWILIWPLSELTIDNSLGIRGPIGVCSVTYLSFSIIRWSLQYWIIKNCENIFSLHINLVIFRLSFQHSTTRPLRPVIIADFEPTVDWTFGTRWLNQTREGLKSFKIYNPCQNRWAVNSRIKLHQIQLFCEWNELSICIE